MLLKGEREREGGDKGGRERDAMLQCWSIQTVLDSTKLNLLPATNEQGSGDLITAVAPEGNTPTLEVMVKCKYRNVLHTHTQITGRKK